LNQHLLLPKTSFQRALYYLWLLVNFLEHEVAILAFVGGFCTFMVLNGFTLDGQACRIPDLHAVAANLGNIPFFQVHEAVGHLAQRQLVGCQKVFSKAQAYYKWATTPSGNQTVRLF
jgi:hypothetical protein